MFSNMKFNRNSTVAQNFICGCVLFFELGIYVAVLNLGAGGGGVDATSTANIVNASLYGTFAVAGFFGGSIVNTIGPKWTLMIGAFGYPFYISGLWFFDDGGSSSNAYPVIGGVVLGVCAGLLWTSSNFICFCYSSEHQKATFYFVQASLAAFGNLIAACVVMGFSFNDSTLTKVPEAVYASFFSLMMVGMTICLFLCDPRQVRRDGEPIAIFKQETWFRELKGTLGLLAELKIWLVCPFIFCCEIPLILQGTISAYWFNVRTRALCIFIGPIFQIITSYLLGRFLDNKKMSRRLRAYSGIGTFFIFSAAAYTGELAWMHTRPAGTFTHANEVDWTDSRFAPFFIIFLLFQICIAIAPMYASWLVMTFSNAPSKVASYAGLIRSFGAAGAAIFFGVAASGSVTLITESAIHCGSQNGTMIPVVYVIWKYVTETNYEAEKDIVFVPAHETKILHLPRASVTVEGDAIIDASSHELAEKQG